MSAFIGSGGPFSGTLRSRPTGQCRPCSRARLATGWPIIVDAAFLRVDAHATFAALAVKFGLPFAILDCRALVVAEALARRWRVMLAPAVAQSPEAAQDL